MKKIILSLSLTLFIFGSFGIGINQVDAYVSVNGYYKKNGTYVAPYVRSNPNGLKYDNYSYTPSQGLYNKTYGTKGSAWDTPTYITDPSYYIGKNLYESGSSNYVIPSIYLNKSSGNTQTKKITVPDNAYLSSYNNDWYCNKGYKIKYDNSFNNKVGCEKIIVPENASLSYYGTDWYCKSGYKTKFDTSYNKIGCEKIIVPENASLNYYGSDWYCNKGYKAKYNNSFEKMGCEKIVIPQNAKLNYYGTDWYCNDGYKTKYDDLFNKIGCEVR